SPLVATPRRFPAISSHIDVTPSVLAYLEHNYDVMTDDSVQWLGQGLDTSAVFASRRVGPMMRTKTEFDALVSGTSFLDGGEAFSLSSDLTPMPDPAARGRLVAQFDSLRSLARFVVDSNRIRPPVLDVEPATLAAEDSVWRRYGLERMNSDEQFA